MKDEILHKFNDYLSAEFGYSDSTLMAYRGDVALFLDHVAARRLDALQNLQFTREDVLSFLRSEAQIGRRVATLNRRLASLKVFEKFLEDVFGVSAKFVPPDKDSEVAQILSSGRPSSAPNCLTTDQINRLWEVLLASPRRQAVRDLALISLMLEWGFSVNLLLSLEIYDVDLKSHTLWTPSLGDTGAGWKLEYSFAPLARYLLRGRDELSPHEGETHLFISQQGRALSRQSIWHALRKWGREAKLEVILTPRLLRNTAVYRMMKNGISPKTIGMALGHLNPLSTHLLLRRLNEYCAEYEPPELPKLSFDDNLS